MTRFSLLSERKTDSYYNFYDANKLRNESLYIYNINKFAQGSRNLHCRNKYMYFFIMKCMCFSVTDNNCR